MNLSPSIFRCLLLAHAIGLCSATLTIAQDRGATPTQKPPLPSGPILRSWEPKEAWTILFEYTDPTSADAARPTSAGSDGNRKPVFNDNTPPAKILLTKYDPFFTMQYAGRNPAELFRYFVMGDSYFFQAPPKNTTSRGIHPALVDPEARSFSQQILLSALGGGFFGFDWISPSNYVAVEEVAGVPCFVFREGETTAWIDVAKQQPVMWQRGGEIRRFVHDNPPTSYDIPQDVLQRMRGIIKDREALRRRNT